MILAFTSKYAEEIERNKNRKYCPCDNCDRLRDQRKRSRDPYWKAKNYRTETYDERIKRMSKGSEEY